jgi:CheY-like chemotaxis protein
MPEKIDFSKVRFLVVENSQLALDMMQDILMMLGATSIRRCNAAKRALEILRDDEIDVVLTERELEGAGGLELVESIRSSMETRIRLMPVIMVTARSEPEYVAEARDRGVNEFVAKPFTVDTLFRRLASVIAKPRDFVNAEDYFGPDRRRRRMPYDGPERRGNRA